MVDPAPTAITAADGVRGMCAVASAVPGAITDEAIETGVVPGVDGLPPPGVRVGNQDTAAADGKTPRPAPP